MALGKTLRTELDEIRSELSRLREAGADPKAEAASGGLHEQIAELKALETQVQGLLAQMDEKSDARMASLVKSYESMKPKDAAAIFKMLNPSFVPPVASGKQMAANCHPEPRRVD